MLSASRPQGVMIPDSQMRGQGTGSPNTVAHVVPMQPYAVQYFDEHGREHNTIVYKVGNVVYFDHNAERWAAGLGQAAGYIKTAVNADHAAFLSPPAPNDDHVDVLAAEEASAQAQTAAK